MRAGANTVRTTNPNAIVLCHGGPISMSENTEFSLQYTKSVHGCYGASSVERLPTETAVKEQMARFRAVRMR